MFIMHGDELKYFNSKYIISNFYYKITVKKFIDEVVSPDRLPKNKKYFQNDKPTIILGFLMFFKHVFFRYVVIPDLKALKQNMHST